MTLHQPAADPAHDVVPDDELPPEVDVDESAGPSVTRKGLRTIWRFARLHPAPFAMSLVGGVLWAAIVVGASYSLGWVTNQVIAPAFKGGVPTSRIWTAVGLLFLIGLARGASVVVRRWFGAVTEARMQVSLRKDVVDRLLTMPLSEYRDRPTGELMSHADNDVNAATQMLLPLPWSLGVVALIAFSLVSLFSADWVFGLTAVLLFPSLTALSRYFTNRVHGPMAAVQERLGVVSSIAHESFDGALVVKTMGLEEVEVERLHRDLDLADREGERDDHQDEAPREEGLPDADLPEEEDEHADDAQEKARDARGLHVPDEVDPVAQVVDLLQDERVGVLAVRSRRLDVAMMTSVCAAVLYIAWTVDPLGTS